LDAYQSGAIELAELQKRRQLVDAKLAMLEREKALLAKAAVEQKKEADLQTSLAEFARVVTNSLQHISLCREAETTAHRPGQGGRQKLARRGALQHPTSQT
jgi:hypothetical protein